MKRISETVIKICAMCHALCTSCHFRFFCKIIFHYNAASQLLLPCVASIDWQIASLVTHCKIVCGCDYTVWIVFVACNFSVTPNTLLTLQLVTWSVRFQAGCKTTQSLTHGLD